MIDLSFLILQPIVCKSHVEYELHEFINCREEYLAKIERRIREYKFDILNEPREGKKLLVLDIDYTLFGKL